jgi:hypothetical protein
MAVCCGVHGFSGLLDWVRKIGLFLIGLWVEGHFHFVQSIQLNMFMRLVDEGKFSVSQDFSL